MKTSDFTFPGNEAERQQHLMNGNEHVGYVFKVHNSDNEPYLVNVDNLFANVTEPALYISEYIKRAIENGSIVKTS